MRGFVSFTLTLASLSVVLASCSGRQVVEEEVDASTPGMDAASCTMCNGQCADLKVDNMNCGKCGVACPTGATCVQGSCQCASGATRCGDACVDVKIDKAHCGKCGQVCGGPDAAPSWAAGCGGA